MISKPLALCTTKMAKTTLSLFRSPPGFPTNIRNLLESQADDISPLNGYDLVAAKVKTVVWQGGWYPPIHGWGAATFNWACGSGRQLNRTFFGLSFGLKNGLSFHFDSETCLNQPFLNFFLV